MQKPRLTPAEIQQYREEGYTLPAGKVFSDAKFQSLTDHFEGMLEALPKDRRPKGDGRRVPWHEDSAYWSKLLDPMEVATVWLALDPSTRENGCMYVIPRTHNTGKKGFSDYEAVDASTSVFGTEIIPSQRKEELAIPCELQPNHCSLHDARTQHGSPPNTSDMRRCGWTLRYIPASTRLNPEYADRQLLYLARGGNLTGQSLADPTVDYSHVIAERKRKGFRAH